MKYSHGTGILTEDNLLFMTWGRTYFGDQPFYVLKYYPSKEGGRTWRSKSFDKVKPPLYAYDEMIERLESVDPIYTEKSEMLGRKRVLVPEEKIEEVFDPMTRPEEIVSDPQDSVEGQFADSYRWFKDRIYERGMDIEIGVTASLLFGIHDPNSSDIDIVFQGDGTEMLELQDMIVDLIKEEELELELSGFEEDLISNTIQRDVDESLLDKLVEEKRYFSSFVRPGDGTELHVLFIDDEIDNVPEGSSEGRVQLEGKASLPSDAKYVCPEFAVEDDEVYRVICYHKSGALVRPEDHVRLEGHLVSTPEGPVVVQLDEKNDFLHILS